MSWGTELWDQFENISTHTQKGIDFCEKFAHFVKERSTIENDYANKLKRLAKSYQPKAEKNDKKKDPEFTCLRGFYAMVKELNDLAGQHEVIAENLLVLIHKEILANMQETKLERKRLLTDGARLQGAIQNQLAQLDKTKKQYEKQFREAEKAQDAYKKAEQDVHLSKAEVEKVKQQMNLRVQASEDCKAEYAVEVGKTNQAQHEHYEQHMPQVFQQLQEMEEKRVAKVRLLISSAADIENKVMPIISRCIEGMSQAATIVDASQDSQLVIDQFKTGFFPPADVQFEDLSNLVTSSGNLAPKVEVNRLTVSGKQKAKRSGLRGIFGTGKAEEPREDFGHLPPNQQRKQLQGKIETIRGSITKDTQARDALLKMQDVYRATPSLGDPATLDRQLEENAQKLDLLRQEVAKFENYLAEMDRNGNDTGSTPTPSPCPSRHTSEQPASVTSNRQQLGSTVSSSSIGTTPVKPQPQLTEQDSFEDEDLGDLGTCTALYAFEATSDSAISMAEGEKFTIVESDQGDGWTHVQRANGDGGFVPTAYLQCHFAG